MSLLSRQGHLHRVFQVPITITATCPYTRQSILPLPHKIPLKPLKIPLRILHNSQVLQLQISREIHHTQSLRTTTPTTTPTITTDKMSNMSQRLSQKTIFITGASSGIGRSTALEFARTAPTCRLILAARRESSLEELKSEIQSEFKDVQILTWKLDVSNPSEIEGILERLPEGWREVDVLVNNAGLVKGLDPVGSITASDISIMINTNIVGLISLTQEILRSMLKRGDAGRGDIINVGSIAGREGYSGGSIYCATKAAVRTFTEALRKEMVSTRIRVMEIDPGQVETEFSVVRFRGDKGKADAVYAGCEPLTPEDIAEIIVFMAGRRENVVIAETMVFPSHQASAGVMYRRPT